MAYRINAKRHQACVRSLYRSILRGLYKADKTKLVIDSNSEPTTHIAFELRKASLDPELYHRFLISELRYHVNERMRRTLRSSIATYLALEQGDQLVKSFGALQKDPSDASHWHLIIKILVALRDELFQIQKWKEAYFKNREAIDEQRVKDIPVKMARSLGHMKSTPNKVEPEFDSLQAHQRLKEYKKAKSKSEEDSGFVVRNYLKKLQLEGRIPNPYKLPYVSETLTYQSANLPDPSVLLPGSTKTHVMEQAYDRDYIEAIIKPEVEYLINKSFLDEMDEQINEKGPPKVKIQATNAGVMTAFYIGAPFSDKKTMRNIAVDIKKLTRLFKIQHVWNLKASNKVAQAHERKVGNGFAVKGSGGFSEDEVMFTREYYQELADAEANWEALMDDMRHQDLTKSVRKKETLFRQEWREPLDIASAEIDNKLNELCDRNKLLPEHFKRQRELQAALNEKFEKKAERYSNLVSQLQQDNVIMHSDIVNFRNPVEANYSAAFQHDSLAKPKNKKGIPEVERTHMGKKLGDYLAQFGFRSFQMGQKFRERFKF